MKFGDKVIHNCPTLEVVGGKIVKSIQVRDVVLMTISGKYAMVRRKGCAPYVCLFKELALVASKSKSKK